MTFVDRIINENKASEDESWTWPPVQPGKLNCVLCGKVINFFRGSTNEFFQHVEIEHQIYIDHRLLLSIIFLDNETLNDIRDRFRKKVTGSDVLEESFVSDGKDVYEDGSLTDDWDEFDEDKTCHDFTKVLEQNEKETSIMRKENFCNKLIEGNEVLEDVTKYKAGPKSYKIKQVVKNKKDRILLKLDNYTLEESEKHDDFIKNVKNIFESDTNNDKGANFAQHIRPTKHINNSDTITNETLALPNIKLSNHKAECVEAKLVKIHTLESPAQDDQFKPDDTLPTNWKSRKSYQSGRNEQTYETHFLCPDGRKFPSREMAMEYIKQSGIYKEQDFEMVVAKKIFNPLKQDNIPYTPGPKSRRNKRKLKEDSNEILKIKKEIEDDVNSPNYTFLENDWSKLDDQFKRQNTNSASSMIDEIKQIEEEMKNIIYFDILNKDNEKDVISKKFKRSAKSKKQRKASDKDIPSSKCESDGPNSPYPEEINVKMSNVLRYDEEIDSKDINHRNSKKSEQYGIKYPINVEISEYFQQRPNQLSGYNISESLKSQFVFDESLPNGWLIRKIWRQNKKLYDIDYLSPDGRKARSKVAVLEYMKLMGIYSLQDYDKIIQNYELNHYKIFT